LFDKQLLLDLIWNLDYPDVLHFLQDFVRDLVSLRQEQLVHVPHKEANLKATVKQAAKPVFKLHDLEHKEA
jgi:hypothetical protein